MITVKEARELKNKARSDFDRRVESSLAIIENNIKEAAKQYKDCIRVTIPEDIVNEVVAVLSKNGFIVYSNYIGAKNNHKGWRVLDTTGKYDYIVSW